MIANTPYGTPTGTLGEDGSSPHKREPNDTRSCPDILHHQEQYERLGVLLDLLTHQLLNGCGNALCTTPTCYKPATGRSLLSTRKYTQLSARSTALAIASQKNPKAWLCPFIEIASSQGSERLKSTRIDPKSIIQQLGNTRAVRCVGRPLGGTTSSSSSDHSIFASPTYSLSGSTLGYRSKNERVQLKGPDTRATALGFRQFMLYSKIIQQGYGSTRADECCKHVAFTLGSPHILSHSFTDILSLDIKSDKNWLSGLKKLKVLLHDLSRTHENLVLESLNLSLNTLSELADVSRKDDLHKPMSSTEHRTRSLRVLMFCLTLSIYNTTSRSMPTVDDSDSNMRLAQTIVRVLMADGRRPEWFRRDLDLKKNGHAAQRQDGRGSTLLHDLIDLLVHKMDGDVADKRDSERTSDDIHQARVLTSNVIMWLKQVFKTEWNGQMVVRRSSVAGGALTVLESFWLRRSALGIPPDRFILHSLGWCLEDPAFAVQHWLDYRPHPDERHLLSFPFLHARLAHFVRAANDATMREAFSEARRAEFARLRILPHVRIGAEAYLDRRMKVTLSHYLTLKVSRSTVLSDALDQLWQRERRELFRPLRVRIGEDEGEIGADQGGVQIEFYNLIVRELFNPERSLFAIDADSKLMWFSPFSMEPLYRTELIGLLFGLAVYNGITVPVSFPRAFYVKLLGLRPSSEDFAEGWPSLAKNLQDLVNFEGDVEEVFSRDFTYGFLANGLHVEVDMAQPWDGSGAPGKAHGAGKLKILRTQPSKHHPARKEVPSPGGEDEHHAESGFSTAVSAEEYEWPGWDVEVAGADEEPRPVTNENRTEYQQAYAQWVMDYSVRPQFYAFAKGFYQVNNPKVVGLLTPDVFRELVEGHEHIDIERLQHATRYDGCAPLEPLIEWFWEVVKAYPAEQHKLLLEFVTGSKRVPADGAQSLNFIIQRVHGQPHALPSSATCASTLKLPQYGSKALLKKKLDIALEHSLGFGTP